MKRHVTIGNGGIKYHNMPCYCFNYSKNAVVTYNSDNLELSTIFISQSVLNHHFQQSAQKEILSQLSIKLATKFIQGFLQKQMNQRTKVQCDETIGSFQSKFTNPSLDLDECWKKLDEIWLKNSSGLCLITAKAKLYN